MIRKRLRFALVAVLPVLICAGCASKARLTTFDDFAKAGNSYAGAIDTLIDKAAETLANADSEKLLQARELAPVAPGKFDKLDEAIRSNMREFGMIRQSVALLAEYFDSLAALANSNAPDAFASELETTVSKLDQVATDLENSALLKDPSAAAGLAGKAGGLIVQGVQVGQLEKVYWASET